MTREERDLDGLIVPGSDHLTAYNLYAEAFETAGRMGEVYGLPRHLFDEERIDRWADRRGALVKSIEDAALGMASIHRSLNLPLPERMPNAGEMVLRKFQKLLAQFMPFTLVIDEELPNGEEARVSKTSVCGSWGAIAGELRYFADKFGTPRASIEGTQVPSDLLRQYATHGDAELLYDPERRRTPLAVRRRVEYFGFELEREIEGIEEFPPELAEQARHVLAESLAKGQARHHAVKRNRVAIEEIREAWRRSGGSTPRLGLRDLTAWYEERLRNVSSLEQFRSTDLTLDAEAILPSVERERWLALPDLVELRGKEIPLDYDVEDSPTGPRGVVRLRLPEKMARSMTAEEIPPLDRPVRFTVTRGQRGAVRAESLGELQELLDRPWTEEELEEVNRQQEARREAARQRRQEKKMHEAKRELREGRARGQRGPTDNELRSKEFWERGHGGRRGPKKRGGSDRNDRTRGGPPRRGRSERNPSERGKPRDRARDEPRDGIAAAGEVSRPWNDAGKGRREGERRDARTEDETELREDRHRERRGDPRRDESTRGQSAPAKRVGVRGRRGPRS
jgi:hypothetical protein